MTMCRPQEFFECDSLKLRNNQFTFEEFIDHFTDEKGKFTYFLDWSGFNIPGFILDSFFKKFELTRRENILRNLVKKFSGQQYYVIATKKDDEMTVKHELVHAYYHMDPEYKKQADILIKNLEKPLRDKLVSVLKDWGYLKKVFYDEINAYLSTSSLSYLKSEFGMNFTQDCVKPFRRLANKRLRQ